MTSARWLINFLSFSIVVLLGRMALGPVFLRPSPDQPRRIPLKPWVPIPAMLARQMMCIWNVNAFQTVPGKPGRGPRSIIARKGRTTPVVSGVVSKGSILCSGCFLLLPMQVHY
ncbi:hypothetical protein F5Y15DRAFT_404376 [Xylariaceae sp. FL0016]|nr:hypothetical protein F5Y15DRAFT_404376 [Xylariaceae sp. FL0016]